MDVNGTLTTRIFLKWVLVIFRNIPHEESKSPNGPSWTSSPSKKVQVTPTSWNTEDLVPDHACPRSANRWPDKSKKWSNQSHTSPKPKPRGLRKIWRAWTKSDTNPCASVVATPTTLLIDARPWATHAQLYWKWWVVTASSGLYWPPGIFSGLRSLYKSTRVRSLTWSGRESIRSTFPILQWRSKRSRRQRVSIVARQSTMGLLDCLSSSILPSDHPNLYISAAISRTCFFPKLWRVRSKTVWGDTIFFQQLAQFFFHLTLFRKVKRGRKSWTKSRRQQRRDCMLPKIGNDEKSDDGRSFHAFCASFELWSMEMRRIFAVFLKGLDEAPCGLQLG